MRKKECVPFAPALIESMRSLGYSFPSAIADLIDNSVSAGASEIKIITSPGEDPDLILFDNGCGMTEKELYEAMRYGSQNPLEKRDENDLGRFGLGLKAASLSQCRKLVVISKKEGVVCGYSWDLDFVIENESWTLQGFSKRDIKKFPKVDMLDEVTSGTYVYLSNFDRVKESSRNVANAFNGLLEDMIEHLSLVFHRFIEDGLIMDVNGQEIKAKDPFLKDHKATQRMRESSFQINGEIIKLKPYILPHLSKLKQKDLDKVGGKERLRGDQGFYIYRNKRLIIWGTWFRLERKDELSKLARIRVDIPNSLDYMWSIDVKKSTATLPNIIKENMYNAVFESVSSSEKIHTYRGKRKKVAEGNEYIWERLNRKNRDGYEYQINREIPQIKLLAATLDNSQLKLLDSLVTTIERALPMNAMYVDMAKGEIQEKKELEEDELWNEIGVQIESAKVIGLEVKDIYKSFLTVEPYCYNEKIRERIKEVLDSYED